MKDIIITIANIIITIAVCITLLAITMHITKADEYPATMLVTELEYATDTVVCEDGNGNMWEFEGIEDWMVGDRVAAIMSTKGTESIYDDEFVMVRYNVN